MGRARIAEKRHDMRLAEQELRRRSRRRRIKSAESSTWSGFCPNRAVTKKSDELFQQAAAMAPDSRKVVFKRAVAYVKSGRNLELAKTLLQRYAEPPVTGFEPPRSEAARLIGKASRRARRG